MLKQWVVHGEVLSQWPEMFRILSLSGMSASRGFFSRFVPIFLFTYSFVLYNIVPSLSPQSKPDGEAQNNIAQQNCERLVRVPIDELQERQSSKL